MAEAEATKQKQAASSAESKAQSQVSCMRNKLAYTKQKLHKVSHTVWEVRY
jgi:hypothetical protein